MANDRKTKSFEVKPERRPDQSDAIRASDERGGRLARGGASGVLAGGKDADLRAHGESGSSGVGLPPAPDNAMRIHTRDGASTDTNPDQDRGTDNER